MEKAIANKRIRTALELEAPAPDPGFSARVLAARPEAQARPQRWPVIAAAILAVAVVAGLLVAGHRIPAGTRTPAAQPSAAGRPTAPAATPSVPGSVLPAATLQAGGLENVANLIVPLDVSSDSGGQTVRLVAAYVDSIRTVFVLRGVSGGLGTSLALYDAQGLVNGSSSGLQASSGDYVYWVNAAPRVGTDGLADVRLEIDEYEPATSGGAGPYRPRSSWSLAARIPVQPSQMIATPGQVQVGGLTFQLATVEVTPNAIHVAVFEQGASIAQLNPAGSPGGTLLLAGPDGGAPRTLASGAAVTTPKQQLTPETAKNVRVESTWVRGAPGTYRLTISHAGDQKTLDLTVP